MTAELRREAREYFEWMGAVIALQIISVRFPDLLAETKRGKRRKAKPRKKHTVKPAKKVPKPRRKLRWTQTARMKQSAAMRRSWRQRKAMKLKIAG